MKRKIFTSFLCLDNDKNTQYQQNLLFNRESSDRSKNISGLNILRQIRKNLSDINFKFPFFILFI